MKTTISKIDQKKQWEYKTITLQTRLTKWQLATVWDRGANATMDKKGNIVIVIRKRITK